MTQEAIWLFLDRLSIAWANLLMLVAIVGFVRRDAIKRWWRRPFFGEVGSVPPRAPHFGGLLLPVSRAEVPKWLISSVRPSALALIVTDQSSEAGRAIKEHARRLGIAQIETAVLENPDDVAQCRKLALGLLRRMRETGVATLAADTTGGKVPMSLGVFMAAEEVGAATLYVSAEYDSGLNRPRLDTARLICLTTPRT